MRESKLVFAIFGLNREAKDPFCGQLLFASAATKYVINPAFLLKLGFFVHIALIVHIVNQQKAKTWGQTPQLPAIAKYAGLFELLLWICVVSCAVSIPNFETI